MDLIAKALTTSGIFVGIPTPHRVGGQHRAGTTDDARWPGKMWTGGRNCLTSSENRATAGLNPCRSECSLADVLGEFKGDFTAKDASAATQECASS